MRGLLAGFVMLVAGCAVTPEEAPFMPVSREPAVVRWQKGGKAFLRDAICERSKDGTVRVTVGKDAGERCFTLEANGWMATRGWEGQAGSAPMDLVVWASFLTIYQNADRLPDGERELHTPASRVAVDKSSKGLRSLSILNVDEEETLSVVFR